MGIAEEVEGVELELGVDDGKDSVVLLLVLEICVGVVRALVLGRVFEVDFAVALSELCPSLNPPDPSIESSTFGQSVLTPAFAKNKPISVSEYALAPLH